MMNYFSKKDMEILINKNKLLNGDIKVYRDDEYDEFFFKFGYVYLRFKIDDDQPLIYFFEEETQIEIPLGEWDLEENKPYLSDKYDFFNKNKSLIEQYNEIMYKYIYLDDTSYILEEWCEKKGSIYLYDSDKKDNIGDYYGEYKYNSKNDILEITKKYKLKILEKKITSLDEVD